jgi:hypothetical protein
VDEDSLRAQLSRRLDDLIARHQRLRATIEEARRDLQLTVERIEAAARLYELEYEEHPPQLAEIDGGKLLPEPERIPRRVRVGTNWAYEIAHVLAEAGKPLHVQQIWERLRERGFRTNSSDPLRAIVATTSRRPDLLVRTAPNTYTLANLDAAPAVAIPTELLTMDAQSISGKRAAELADDELETAARLIRDDGAPPLVAVPDPTLDGHYRVIDGHRRLLAARKAALARVATIVIDPASTPTGVAERPADPDPPS